MKAIFNTIYRFAPNQQNSESSDVNNRLSESDELADAVAERPKNLF